MLRRGLFEKGKLSNWDAFTFWLSALPYLNPLIHGLSWKELSPMSIPMDQPQVSVNRHRTDVVVQSGNQQEPPT